MKKRNGFGLIGVLLIIGALVVVTGGVLVWQKKVSLTPVPTPTPTETTPISCRTDADCPPIDWLAPCNGDCPRYYCQQGKCVLLTPTQAVSQDSSLNEKIKLTPGQTVTIRDADLSLSLLRITLSQEDCFVCPVDTEVEIKSGGRIESVVFRTPGIATKEWGTHRIKEVFGFQIRLESVQPELIILGVQKL